MHCICTADFFVSSANNSPLFISVWVTHFLKSRQGLTPTDKMLPAWNMTAHDEFQVHSWHLYPVQLFVQICKQHETLLVQLPSTSVMHLHPQSILQHHQLHNQFKMCTSSNLVPLRNYSLTHFEPGDREWSRLFQ